MRDLAFLTLQLAKVALLCGATYVITYFMLLL
jgi:hypothetical protein